MAKFGKNSISRLSTCDEALQRVAYEAIKDFDFTVICGRRNEQEQNDAFRRGKSKLKYPESKHNSFPSQAMDLAPCKYRNGSMYIDWEDVELFDKLAEHILAVAKRLGVPIRWGGTFKNLVDRPHFELI